MCTLEHDTHMCCFSPLQTVSVIIGNCLKMSSYAVALWFPLHMESIELHVMWRWGLERKFSSGPSPSPRTLLNTFEMNWIRSFLTHQCPDLTTACSWSWTNADPHSPRSKSLHRREKKSEAAERSGIWCSPGAWGAHTFAYVVNVVLIMCSYNLQETKPSSEGAEKKDGEYIKLKVIGQVRHDGLPYSLDVFLR